MGGSQSSASPYLGEEHMSADENIIEVENIIEHDDGSATVVINTTKEATRFLVDLGFRTLLERALDAEDNTYSFAEYGDEQETPSV